MNNLVTLDEARDHLRLDEGPDDTWLATWIPVVSEAVALWLKDEWRLYQPEVDSDGEPVLDSDGRPVAVLDSGGEPVVRWTVKAACLVELASQSRFRECEGKDNSVPAGAGNGYVLSKASPALLKPLRGPTV